MIQESYENLCKTQDANWPVPAFYCVLPDGKPDFFKNQGSVKVECKKAGGEVDICACCCACMAYGTMIALSAERQEKVESIRKGEQVLTGSLTGDGTVVWRPALVTFSDGAAGGANLNTMHMSFGQANEKVGELVCSSDQPVLLADGTLVQASQVHVRDELMGGDGQPVPVRSVAIGEYTGGLHHLGVGRSADPAGGHLLHAAGIVIGDYYLQLQPDLLADNWSDDAAARPHIWDEEYAEQNGAEQHGVSLVFGTPGCGNETALAEGKFTVFTGPVDYTGTDVAALFTPGQAEDIRTRGKQLSAGNKVPQFMVETVFSHLRGFYPDIDFYLDWDQPEPNVYAVRRFGRKTVVVTGGLARTRNADGTGLALEFPGMVMAVAHGIARHSGEAPLNTHGFSNTGRADHHAFHYISATFWWGKDILRNASPAEDQFNALFDLVTEANGQGNPDPAADEPSIACRRQCVSFTSPGSLPECAGGPPPLRLALEDAAATRDTLTLAVNLAPKPETVTPVGNYTITPATEILQATPASDSVFHIVVKVKTPFEPGTPYRITIHELESELGTGVDPQHASLEFTALAAPVPA
ncbi:hypothetical protein [Embleya sp. NPDC020630]|uniref:hypothetical protein n=1 Tax=Embleya sp. NPDC020630 TaxID=3363979 RepID=UPI0037A521AA